MELEKVRFIALFQLSSFYPSVWAPHFSPDLQLLLGWRRTGNVHMDWGRAPPWCWVFGLSETPSWDKRKFLCRWSCCPKILIQHLPLLLPVLISPSPLLTCQLGQGDSEMSGKNIVIPTQNSCPVLYRLLDAVFHLLSENSTNVILLLGISRETFINFLLLLVFWNCSILCCNF